MSNKPKLYIGCKVIEAVPMTRGEFEDNKAFLSGAAVTSDTPVETTIAPTPGYQVKYPDGYVSWSPKEVFEKAYREIQANELFMIEDHERHYNPYRR